MAENSGQIYITITDDRGGSKSGVAQQQVAKKQTEQQNPVENLVGQYVAHEFFNLVKSKTSQVVNYTLGNIGNFTGDYQTQRQVNYARGVVDKLSGIGLATFAGAKYGGVYGAIAGFAVAVVSEGVNIALEAHTNAVQTRKQNYNIDQLRKLSGLDPLTNGSR